MRTLILLLVSAIIASGSALYGGYNRSPITSIQIASMKLLKNLYEQSSDKNVVLSPLGVLSLLSLYASGSEGKSREEILQLLGSTNYVHLSDFYSNINEILSSMDPNFLILANKMFVSDKYSLDDGFLNESRKYKTDVENINFEDSEAAVDAINDWSSKKTNGIISKPVSQSDIDPETAVALLNVIFFQGHWHVPFNASETKEQDFNIDKSTVVKKPMMHLIKPLLYFDDITLGAKWLELPYKESHIRMIIVLPTEINGLPRILEKVSEEGLDSIWQLTPQGVNIKLDMPQFEIKTKTNLNEILPKVGVNNIFENGSMGIIKERSVKVSKALQEAFIKVNEEGATAGAFTGYVLQPMSFPPQPPPSIPFKVDRPFLYLIVKDQLVLFAGTYTH